MQIISLTDLDTGYFRGSREQYYLSEDFALWRTFAKICDYLNLVFRLCGHEIILPRQVLFAHTPTAPALGMSVTPTG